jgi:glycogen debranching enzyme
MSLPDAVNLRLDADVLTDLAAASRCEWLTTNGLGGYASSSLAGANTRRYHGLLVAALNPPLGRAVLLSKLEETLEMLAPDGSSSPTFGLSANLYAGAVYPQGYQHLVEWTAYPAPTWVWSPQSGVRLEKRVWMARGRNVTYISYRLLEAPEGHTAHLHLVPLLAWKDYHSEMVANERVPDMFWFPDPPQTTGEVNAPLGLLRVTLPDIQQVTAHPTRLDLDIVREDGMPFSGATFDRQAFWYYKLQHPREAERGQNYEEDLYALGMISAILHCGETLVVVASAHEITESHVAGEVGGKDATLETLEPVEIPPDSPEKSWNALIAHQAALLASQIPSESLPASAGPAHEAPVVPDVFQTRLALAVDPFLVQVPGGRSSIIAGYPWFSDWGRDTMIALPGLCLTTGQLTLARDILSSFAGFVDKGMLPNRFPDVGEAPEYNTVDATLWYVVAIYRYIEASGDIALLRDTLWAALEEIVAWHQRGTRYQIHVDPNDSLLYAGQEGAQLTWMDAKVGNWVVTPRTGKPVEINALWISALHTMAHFAGMLDRPEEQSRYNALTAKATASFVARFARSDGRGLYDVLDTPNHGLPDAAIRPNQIFALSLPFAPVAAGSDLAAAILEVVQAELVTPFGLRTLSPEDPAYRPRYEGDSWHRDGAYHEGTAWPWLLGPFAEAHYRHFADREAALALLRPLAEQMTDYGVGSLAEIYDGDAPQRPNGCIAQAWSVSETLRVLKVIQSS